MKTIAYIVPYFGSFPNLFPLWLNSCRYNTAVDWLVFTDDKTRFNYPENVHVEYMSFENLKVLVQSRFEYEIKLESPYKLCDYKIAYGDIFSDYLTGYDFWGFCDLDLIWGDIRHFLTDEVLSKFDKIGFQGHSMLVRNDVFYRTLYKCVLKDGTSFKGIAQEPNNCMADEKFFNYLADELKIPSYQEVTFANLTTLFPNFRLTYLPDDEKKKNKHLIFKYQNGKLMRMAVVNNNVYCDEFMYIHFLKREIEVCVSSSSDSFLIIPNKIISYCEVDSKYIKKVSSFNLLMFLFRRFKDNAYKLNRHTLLPILKKKINLYFGFATNSLKKY